MSETTNQPEESHGEMTPEQIQDQLNKMHSYYDEQIALLSKEAEFYKISADIEEHQLRALTMRMRKAQIMAGPPPTKEEKPSESENAERPVRKLKKD
jgi:hypothetical protein